MLMADTPPKHGPGRPPGAKNKPKDAPEPPPVSGTPPPPNGDTPPTGTTSPRRGRINKRDTVRIEEAFKDILCAPAVPAAAFGDEWLADHFEESGEVFANKIAVVSERHPHMRAKLLEVMEGESILVLGAVAFAYLVPPLAHFGLLPGPKSIPKVKPLRRKGPKPGTGGPADATVWPGDEPAYTETGEPVHVDGPEPQMAAEFSNGDGPPTFVEVPV